MLSLYTKSLAVVWLTAASVAAVAASPGIQLQINMCGSARKSFVIRLARRRGR